MKDTLKDINLPANILSLLEGFPVQMPSFPELNVSKEEDRILPGGPSSSSILNKKFEELDFDIKALATELVRLKQQISSATVSLNGLNTVQNSINSSLICISGNVTGTTSVVDFYNPGDALQISSEYSINNLYGQITLPYLTSPQSQLLRPSGHGSRPGTIVRYNKINRSSLNASSFQTYQFDESDPESLFAVDGKLDTGWCVPINSLTEDLLVSIVLPPTLGANALVNSIGIIPWPLYGATIVEVWIRNGGDDSSTIPGWTEISLAGQLGYSATDKVIYQAGAHRLFFNPSPVKEIIVRLRPSTTNILGLINFDCWAIDFNTIGSLVINAAEVGITDVKSVSLAGLNPSNLTRLPVSLNNTEITINLSSASTGVSPVLTSVAIIPLASGEIDTGFEYSVWAP